MPDASAATGGVLYVDTSALVKLVVREPESDAVEREFARWSGLATSSLTAVELARALMRARAQERAGVADDARAADFARAMAEVPMTTRVLSVASGLEPAVLRALDAIHLASALALGSDLGAIATYDDRLAAAAGSHGIAVLAPA